MTAHHAGPDVTDCYHAGPGMIDCSCAGLSFFLKLGAIKVLFIFGELAYHPF